MLFQRRIRGSCLLKELLSWENPGDLPYGARIKVSEHITSCHLVLLSNCD